MEQEAAGAVGPTNTPTWTVMNRSWAGHGHNDAGPRFGTAMEPGGTREVMRLMVNLIFVEDDEALTKPGVVRSLYDPTGGTGGMPV